MRGGSGRLSDSDSTRLVPRGGRRSGVDNGDGTQAPKYIFHPRFCGKVYQVTIGNSKASKSMKDVKQIVMSLDGLELCTSDLLDVLKYVPATHVKDVLRMNNAIGLKLIKSAKKDDIMKIIPGKEDAEELFLALQPVPFTGLLQMGTMDASDVLPSMGITAALDIMDRLKKDGCFLLSLLQYWEPYEMDLGNIMACALKKRFPGGVRRDAVECVATIRREIGQHFIVRWLSAIETALTIDKLGEMYRMTLVVNLANTVVLLADELSLNTDSFLERVTLYCNNKDAPEMLRETVKLKERVKSADGGRQSTCEDDVEDIYNMVLLVVSVLFTETGKLLLDDIVDACVQVTMQRPGSEKICLPDMASNIAGILLRKMNNRRYDSRFQYVFAMWSLRKGPIA